MAIKSVNTFECRIYLGAYKKHTEYSEETLIEAIQEFQGRYSEKIPVRITNTRFVTAGYEEPGWEIATLNYPRIPLSNAEVREFCLSLAKYLVKEFDQDRVSLISPTLTMVIEAES